MKVYISIFMLFCFATSFYAQSQPGKKLNVAVLTATATKARIDNVPERYRDTAIQNNTICYLVLEDKIDFTRGMDPKYIIGLLKSRELGITEGNIITNPAFLDYIFKIASKCINDKMIDAMKKSEVHMIALFDERVPDIYLPIKDLMNDIIGLYLLKDGVVSFQPNEQFSYFSKYGFMKLTPKIRKMIEKEEVDE
jgi:hypothetical protein